MRVCVCVCVCVCVRERVCESVSMCMGEGGGYVCAFMSVVRLEQNNEYIIRIVTFRHTCSIIVPDVE